MNFKVFMLLTAIPFIVGNATYADESNLLVNPSFEQADAKGFVADEWWTRKGIQVERNTDDGRTGSASVRFLDDSDSQGQMLESRRIPARPGGNYTASAWLRTSGA